MSGGLSTVKPETKIETDPSVRKEALNKLFIKSNVEAPRLTDGQHRKTFAAAPNNQVKELEINMTELIEMQKEEHIEGNTAIVQLAEEEIREEKQRTIIYKTYNNKAHKIDRMPGKAIESALKPI